MARQQQASVAAARVVARPRLTVLQTARLLARRQPLGVFGLGVAIFMVVVAVLAPWIENFDPLLIDKQRVLVPPNATNWFGTDNLGRDTFSRVVEGSQTAVFVGFLAPIIIQLVANSIAIPSAFFGGKYDLIVQRFVDAWDSLPTIILALGLVAVLGPSMFNVVLAIGLTRGAGGTSRVIRSQALRIREMDHVLAARALGASNLRIMLRHIMPQTLPVVIVLVSVEVPGAILAEASLSFLGLGVPPPHPSWGGMLSGIGRAYLLSAPWIALAPGIAISVVVFGYNMLGDAVRDTLDPRLRGSRG